MGLTEKQVEDLILRADKFKGKVWEIRGKKFIFSKAGAAEVISAKGDPEEYKINGILETEDGDMLTKPLKKVVMHFEKLEKK